MTETAPNTTNRKLALYFTAFFAFFFITGSGHFYVVDELTRYNVTVSVFEKHTLAIENGYGDIGRDGKLYSKYGLLQSIVALPLYAAGKAASALAPENLKQNILVLAVSALNQILTALACVLLIIFAERRLRLPPRAALATALLYTLCTMAWQYSRTFFVEPLICAILLAQTLIATGKPFRQNIPAPISPALALGALSALNILARAETIIYAPLFLALCVYFSKNNRRRIRDSALYCAPVAAAISLLLWYNLYRYGSPLNFGYAGESFTTPMSKGLYLLLLSPGKGIFWYSPALLLIFPAAPAVFKTDKYTASLIAALALIPLALYSRWNLPGGDLSWGPRYLLTTVTLLTACAIPGAQKLLAPPIRKTGAPALALLLAASIFIQILSISFDFHLYTDILFNTNNTASPVRKKQIGYNYINYKPSYSPIAAHGQALRFMLDHDYKPPLFDFGPATKATLEKAIKPDFTIQRLLK